MQSVSPYKKLLAFIFLFIGVNAYGQIYNFKWYSLDEGLSQSQVSAFCYDKKGYIWMASEGGGLNRFDGKTFTVFTMKNGLSSNMIWSLYCDSKGNIWIGTQNGITLYDGTSFKVLESKLRIKNVPIWDITEDQEGNIWFATGGLGVLKYKDGLFEQFGIIDGLGFSEAYVVYCDEKGDVWAGSSGYGIARYHNNTFKNISEAANLKGRVVNTIVTGSNHQLLVFTEEGMQRFDGTSFSMINSTSIPYDDVNKCVFDKKGNYWLSTSSNGIYCFKQDDTLHFLEENGLPSNYIVTLFLDQQDNLWAGFDGAGCAVYQGARFVYYDKYSGLPNSVVKCFAKDNDNNLWVGTEKGIVMFDGNHFYQPKNIDQLSSNNIHALYFDQNNTLWIGTDHGAASYKNEKITEYNPDDVRYIGSAFVFFEHPKRGLWFGCDDGVYEKNGNRFVKIFKDTLREQRVYSIREYKENSYLICSDVGLTTIENGKAKFSLIEDEFGPIDVLDAWIDPTQTIWLITGRGVVKIYPDKTRKNIKTNDGLTSENLYFILYDGEFLWLGSDKGLDKLSLDDNFEITAIRHYGKSEGFAGVETNFKAALQFDPSTIYFGTVKGMVRYKPAADFTNTFRPKVYLTGLRLMYEKIDWRTRYENLSDYSDVPKNLSLSHKDNHLTFDFIGFEYSNPEKIKYQFYLEGFDPTWLPITSENSATYSYLSPGNYTFHVKAGNSDNYWSEPISYSFTIDSPFYKKTWFIILCIVVGVTLIYLFLIFRTRKLDIDKRRLEEKVRLRTEEINKQKQELEKLSIVAAKMNEAVFICDKHGNIDWINDSVIRMAGYTPEDFADSYLANTKNIKEIISDEKIKKAVDNLEKEPTTFIYDSPHTTKQGDIVWTRGSFVPILDDQQQLSRIIAIYTDITDHQNAEIALEKWKSDFTDSIHYAKRIQEALLPPKNLFQLLAPDSFILHLPRDIVSGDFYWFALQNNHLIWATADCTGHGVPGAFMSLIGNEFLDQNVKNNSIYGPDECLYVLNQQLKRALHLEGEERESRDGIDIGLCAIDVNTKVCQFSGANIPLYLIRDNEIIVYEGVKDSVGGHINKEKTFFSHELSLLKNDCLYMTTDGYVDQFGGPAEKKFMRKRFKELLLSIHKLPMEEQKIILDTEFAKWKGDHRQLDDVLVMGMRI